MFRYFDVLRAHYQPGDPLEIDKVFVIIIIITIIVTIKLPKAERNFELFSYLYTAATVCIEPFASGSRLRIDIPRNFPLPPSCVFIPMRSTCPLRQVSQRYVPEMGSE